jgi:FkbM family methyltransferase
MISRVKSIVRAVLRWFDIDVHRYSNSIRPKRIRTLKENSISVVLDVGANTGQYARELRTDGYIGRIVSFEPLADAFSELTRNAAPDTIWECRQLALASAEGTAEINIAENSVSSSLLPMSDRHLAADPHSAYSGTQTVDMVRLDSLRYELLDPADRVYLKMDVQGYELEVLQGASEMLNQVLAIETELSVVQLYEKQVLLHEMIKYLYAIGFTCTWLEKSFLDPDSSDVLHLDGIFVRRS